MVRPSRRGRNRALLTGETGTGTPSGDNKSWDSGPFLPPSGSSLTVEELDGAPTVSPVDTIKFHQDDFTVVDNADGSVTVTTDEPDTAAHLADSGDAHDASAISIVDTGGYFTGTDVEAALQEIGAAGPGGGGGTGSFIGYNTAGGSFVGMTAHRVYCKKVTLAGDTQFHSIDAYMRPTTDNITGIHATILADNSNAPGGLVAAVGVAINEFYLSSSSSMPGTGRWVSIPMGAFLGAGDYWITVQMPNANVGIAYDGSGGDKHFTASGFYATSAYPSAWSITTTTDRFSIRARVTT
jgi:hypothetical protein